MARDSGSFIESRLHAPFTGVNLAFIAEPERTLNNACMGDYDGLAVWSRIEAELIALTAKPAQLAKLLNESGQNIHNWSRRGVPAGRVQEVAAAFEHLPKGRRLNPDWLREGTPPKFYLHGEGTLPVYDSDDLTGVGPESYLFVNEVSGKIFESGTGGISWEHEEIDRSHAFQRAWIAKKGWRPERLKIYKNHGRSNAPWILDGDIVMVHLQDNVLLDSDDPTKNVFAIQYGEHSRFKRIVPQHDGSVLLRSFNADKQTYPDERVAGDDLDTLAIIGRVVWRGG